MNVEVISINGTNTISNRDTYLHATNRNIDLYVVLDGCSSKPKSGDFSVSTAEYVKNAFEVLSEGQLEPKNVKASLERIFQSARQNVGCKYPEAGLSLAALAVINDSVALVLHIGDCSVGYINRANHLYWVTQPHTLLYAPIEEIMNSPLRHYLKRVFKYNGKQPLEWKVRPFNGSDRYILATDGWWDVNNSKLGKLPSDDVTMLGIQRRKPT